MARDDIERSFPGLQPDHYRITSPEDAVYNCVAWAMGESDRWWDPAASVDSGRWTSKLGVAEDIENDTAESLEGELYGKVIRFMSKKRSQ